MKSKIKFIGLILLICVALTLCSISIALAVSNPDQLSILTKVLEYALKGLVKYFEFNLKGLIEYFKFLLELFKLALSK